jgi:predicted TIM-barrel fold metal-dependent hydrolase
MLEAHEASGVTHALVSDSFYMESAATALPAWSPADRARLYNDALAALLARYPGRLFGVGCVDPFAGEAAARELERMVGELGFAGALVNPSDAPFGGRRYLDDPACGPLLAAAQAQGRPLFIHPSRDLPAAEHYDDFVMSLIVGRPSQTAVCAARLIFTGTLDRYPRLPLLLAHGGGVLPAMAGRLDATWRAYRPDRWQGPDVLTVPPSSYLRRFHVDSNVWSLPAATARGGAGSRPHPGRQRPAAGVVPARGIARAAGPARAVRRRSRGRPLAQREPALRAGAGLGAAGLLHHAAAELGAKPQVFREDPARHPIPRRPGMDGENRQSGAILDMP